MSKNDFSNEFANGWCVKRPLPINHDTVPLCEEASKIIDELLSEDIEQNDKFDK